MPAMRIGAENYNDVMIRIARRRCRGLKRQLIIGAGARRRKKEQPARGSRLFLL
jgi:hypothetical protein